MTSVAILFNRKRFGEWIELLNEERRSTSALAIFWKLLKMGALVLRFRAVSIKVWEHRMRKCKGGCPLYDPELKRCGPFTGAEHGCGCYMPFAAIFKKHGWGYENAEGFEEICW